jgi:hypothetical protein
MPYGQQKIALEAEQPEAFNRDHAEHLGILARGVFHGRTPGKAHIWMYILGGSPCWHMPYLFKGLVDSCAAFAKL